MPAGFDIARTLEPYHHVRYRAPCNLDCFYCYEKPHPGAGSLSADTLTVIEENLQKARAAGYRVAVFGAGELLLFPFWQKAVSAARDQGFDDVVMLSNLLSMDLPRLQQLFDAGLTGVVGTIFALDDESARAVSEKKNVFTRQTKAARMVAGHEGLNLSLHLMLTRSVEQSLLGNILRLRDALVSGLDGLMLSAIEPVTEAVRNHPCYTHGLDNDWESLFEKADREGLLVVTQNIPACILGRYAHRSLFLRTRTARILAGWPEDPALALMVNKAESLWQRIPPVGICVDCPLLAVCHRYFDYPVKRKVDGVDDLQVVRRLFDEASVQGDSVPVVAALKKIESRTGPEGEDLSGSGHD